jgi:hypothetical protein
MKGSGKIGLEDFIPVRILHPANKPITRNSSIIHENIYRWPAPEKAGYRGFNGCGITDVKWKKLPVSPFFSDQIEGATGSVLVLPVVERHKSTGARQ